MKKRLLTALMIVSILMGLMTAPVLADGIDGPPGDGLEILAGSCGTLLASEEQVASITLHNPTDGDVVVHTVNLGVAADVTVAPGEDYTFSAPAVYDENGDAYKLVLTSVSGDTVMEHALSQGTRLQADREYTVSLVRGVLDYYESHGQQTARWITCMVYADENGVDPERSVLTGLNVGVEAGAAELADLKIESRNDNTAAIRVGGTGSLTVTGADITLYGNGGDDFTGIGSALGVADNGTLTVTDTNIYTQGILRCAIFAGDAGTLNLDGVTSECAPGEYQQNVSIPSAGMASPPNGLGIWGNCRAMNLVDDATVNIVNSEIISQDWGTLGVDDVTDGHLNVKDSTIRIKDQGYGAYAIGKCVDVFENCVFDIEYGVVGYAAAGDGSEMHLTAGSKAESRNYYGFVTHQSFNGLNSKIVVSGEGTELNTKLGGIIAKGRGADIEISDGAVVTAETGVLVRAQINDDTGAGSMDGTEVVNVTLKNTALKGDIIQGMGREYEQTDASADAMGGMPMGEMPMGEMPMGEMPMGEMPMGEMPMGEMPMGPGGPGGPGGMGGSAKTESQMNVVLEQAELEGAISSATLDLVIEDGNISFDNIRDVGVVENTTLEHNAFAKLAVTVGEDARWAVTENSYLMELTLEEGGTVEALPGYLLTMTVDGAETEVAPGSYTGEIVLSVAVDENYVPEEVPAEEAPVEEAPEEETPAEEAPAEEAPAEEAPAQETPVEEDGGMSAGAMVAIAAAVVAAVCAVAVALKKKK